MIDSRQKGPDLVVSRKRLRSRLAEARAGLLWELLGLDEHTLSTEPVSGLRTARDVLSHVAAWDDMARVHICLNLPGGSDDLGQHDPGARTGSLYPDRSDRTFDAALGALVSSRTGLLDTLARVPDDELDPRPTGSRSFRARANGCRVHDARHARQLASWRERQGGATAVGPKTLVIAAMRASRKELLTAVAMISVERRSTWTGAGSWTLKGALSHLGASELYTLQAVARLPSRGDSLSTVGRLVAGNRQQSESDGQAWEQVWHDLHRQHQHLLRLLTDFDQDQLERQPVVVSGCSSTIYSLLCDYIARDRACAADVRRALGESPTQTAVGPPRRHEQPRPPSSN